MVSIRRGEISQTKLARNRLSKAASQNAHIQTVRAEASKKSARAAEITALLCAGKITAAEALKIL